MRIRMARLEERLPVNLTVRYGSARDFVVEYAENLSIGGLFVRGAYTLDKGQLVKVELKLPGFGSFTVEAEVAHVLTPEVAEKYGRKPGAGFSITNSPPDFLNALRSYLLRLGKRRDHVVLVSDEGIARLLEAAGYLVRPLPLVDFLLESITRSKEPVIGVVVPRALEGEYTERATAMGAPEMILAVDDTSEIDSLLTELDAELFGAE